MSNSDRVIIVEPASESNLVLPGHKPDTKLFTTNDQRRADDSGDGDDEDNGCKRHSANGSKNLLQVPRHGSITRPKLTPTIVTGKHDVDEDALLDNTNDEDSSSGSPGPSTPPLPHPQMQIQTPIPVPIPAGRARERSSTRQPTVRFRSRVRIGSGLHRHSTREHSTPHTGNNDTISTTSSRSASFSSSISAPLRTHPNYTEGSNWSPLGQRVNGLVSGSGQKKCGALGNLNVNLKREKRRREALAARGMMDERTPLMAGNGGECVGDDDGYLSSQIDLVFGKWPGRLLNRHWWWWQLEPVFCCTFLCADDSDEEE